MSYYVNFSGNKTCKDHFVLVSYDLPQYWSLIERKVWKFFSFYSAYNFGKTTNLIMCTQRQINRLHNSRLCVLEFAPSWCDNKIHFLHDMTCTNWLACFCAHVCPSSVISVSLKIVQPIGNTLEKGLPYLVEILASFSSYIGTVNKLVWNAKRKCFCQFKKSKYILFKIVFFSCMGASCNVHVFFPLSKPGTIINFLSSSFKARLALKKWIDMYLCSLYFKTSCK